MTLGCFHASDIKLGLAVFKDVVCGKRMTEFVSENVDISACTVEVGKNERLLVFRKLSAVAATPFSVAREHVECFSLEHAIHKSADLFAHIVIHSASLLEYLFG